MCEREDGGTTEMGGVRGVWQKGGNGRSRGGKKEEKVGEEEGGGGGGCVFTFTATGVGPVAGPRMSVAVPWNTSPNSPRSINLTAHAHTLPFTTI